MAKKTKSDENLYLDKRVTFHYIKSNSFRVLHVDGCIGGLTPQGNIHASVFSERPAIPRERTHALNEDGSLGDRVETVSRLGIVREIDVDLMLDLKTAKAVYAWLGKQIEELETLSDKQKRARK